MASGSQDAAANDIRLTCTELPIGAQGLFVASMSSGFHPGAGGGFGDLCLDGGIGRNGVVPFVAPSSGRVDWSIDLNAIPQPRRTVLGLPGQTWFFQVRYRDVQGGVMGSNFSEAVSLTLR